MRIILATAFMSALGIATAFAAASTVATTPDVSAGAGCMTVTVTPSSGAPVSTVWCPSTN